jgi:hypothetical protein
VTNTKYVANYIQAGKDPSVYLARIAAERAELALLTFPTFQIPAANPQLSNVPNVNFGSGELAFSDQTARQWWDLVTAHPVDYRNVAAGYLPGSKVLGTDEVKVWRAFEANPSAGTPVAPHYWNPLGIVPNP